VCEKNYLNDGNQCCHLQCFISMKLLTFKILLFFHEYPVFTSRRSATSHKLTIANIAVLNSLSLESHCAVFVTGFSETAL
jgi:hypothetical protein